ncbi:MAG: DUF1549 domain-containing protein, partial [Planctomycetaceae bacterium]|nr:DUF1549 domain-containing protein [Planctomycetaceae bacterium]
MKISLVPIRRTVATALLISLSWLSPVEADESPEGLRFFESKIRPVLVAQCYACHSSEAAKQGKLRGQLLLDSREATRQGGESGPAIVPGQPDESLLLSAIRHDSFEMPPKGKLPDSVIADFAKWIEMGAPDPREAGEPVVTSRQIDIEAGREFWSFQPLAHILPPDVADRAEWSLNEIDAFILKRQEDVGVWPNQIAEPRILVRRAWFDLLGLPPTPEEIREWTKRLSSGTTKQGLNRQVWSELLDHLLASEHYGERWARHWMDIWR